MRTRGPHDTEPNESAPIYVHLGMTRGAFWAILGLVVVVAIGFWKINTLAHQNQDAIHRVRTTQVTIKNQQAALAEQGMTLARLTRDLTTLALKGEQAHAAVCEFRGDLARRLRDTHDGVERTKEFLRDHPNGIPGIDAGALKVSIQTQQRSEAGQAATLHALDRGGLTCP